MWNELFKSNVRFKVYMRDIVWVLYYTHNDGYWFGDYASIEMKEIYRLCSVNLEISRLDIVFYIR